MHSFASHWYLHVLLDFVGNGHRDEKREEVKKKNLYHHFINSLKSFYSLKFFFDFFVGSMSVVVINYSKRIADAEFFFSLSWNIGILFLWLG